MLELSKKVLYGIFIVYVIICIKLRLDVVFSKLKFKVGFFVCFW